LLAPLQHRFSADVSSYWGRVYFTLAIHKSRWLQKAA